MEFKGLLQVYQPGNIISFGRYPYEESGAVRPIRWRVMEVEERSVTILAEEVLEARPFDTKSNGQGWKSSDLAGLAEELRQERHFRTDEAGSMWRSTDLCRWLNGEFVQMAFDAQEMRRIMPGENGMVSIPTPDEFVSWFRDETAHGMFFPSSVPEITPRASAGLDMSAPCWWLRGGDGNAYAYIASPVGSIGMSRVDENNLQGVRPVLRLKF